MNKIPATIEEMKRIGINTKLVEDLRKEGWTFTLGVWEDRHKNDTYYELYFQSPNMKKEASIHHTYFSEMTRAYLFERESFAVAADWSDALFNHKLAIQNPISEALREHFKKTKDCKIDYIYSSAIDFQVMVAPKTQTKPKTVKVKITIE